MKKDPRYLRNLNLKLRSQHSWKWRELLYKGEHKGEWNEGLLSLGWIGKTVNPERGWKMGKSRKERDREQEWRKNRQTESRKQNRKDRKLWAKMENSEFMMANFRSVQFSRSVVFDSLWPYGREHTRPPCPSQTPRVYTNSCPLSRWCHPTISSSVVPFSCLQSFPASGSFQMSQLFASRGQSIGVSVPPMNTQDWSPLGWTGWISLQFKGLSRVFSNTTVQKHQFFGIQLSL